MIIKNVYTKYIGIPGLIAAFTAIVACTIKPMSYHDVDIKNQVCIEPYTQYTYRLGRDLLVVIDHEQFIIPKGFKTDLASIPRWYWTFLSPQYSAFVEPSIIHDYFYRCANLKDRAYADEVFYYSLLKMGVTKYTASKFYFAVRMFGAHSYSASSGNGFSCR